MTDAELAELLRSVIARPDDHDSLRVYADCLIERGDLRGELIVVQLQRRLADSLELAAREGEICDRLDAALATDLGQPGLACAWSRGFLEAVDFTPEVERRAIADSLRQLGTLPAARQLRRIVFRFVEPGWGAVGPIVSTLAKVAPQLRSLRELVFTLSAREGDRAAQRPPQFPALERVALAASRLEVLELVIADYQTMRDLRVPALRRLVLEEPQSHGVQWISVLRMQNLEELEIHGGRWSISDLAGYFQHEGKLRHLVIAPGDAERMQLVARDLPDTPGFRTVRTFSLVGAPLDATCIEYLVHHAAHLRRLRRLEIDASPRVARLRDALGDIVVVR